MCQLKHIPLDAVIVGCSRHNLSSTVALTSNGQFLGRVTIVFSER